MNFEKLRKNLYAKLCEIDTLVHSLEMLYTNAQTVTLMNDAAPAFFAQHQSLLIDKIFLEITKLYDPRGDKRGLNVSLPHLVEVVPQPPAALRQQLESAKQSLGRLPEIRNKLLAHTDTAYVGNDLSESMTTVKEMLQVSRALFQMCCGEQHHHLFKPDTFKPHLVRQLENFFNRVSPNAADVASLGSE